MWPVALVGGLTVMLVCLIAFPILIMRGIADFAELFRHAEVEDDET